MSREWKPGDVAMIEVGCHANRHVAMFAGDGWHYRDQWVSDDSTIVSPIRPLVVIDPEDREQVERLRNETMRMLREHIGDRAVDDEAFTECDLANAMQAALREFANPTPPKPEEPQGMGAVVEDVDGIRYVGLGDHYRTGQLRWKAVRGMTFTSYDRIAAVRVLSEGVTA